MASRLSLSRLVPRPSLRQGVRAFSEKAQPTEAAAQTGKVKGFGPGGHTYIYGEIPDFPRGKFAVATNLEPGKPFPLLFYGLCVMGAYSSYAALDTMLQNRAWRQKYGKYYEEGWRFFHYSEQMKMKKPLPGLPQ
eukprot:GDKH01004740.1.p2 GENE.GDKH01004740.1~~GDKH01004740.1.p2  ORF type:complete len:135 (+),score=7.98 GDKH01004740.1:164-568(+)